MSRDSDSISRSREAVSYTHLDVYKRQQYFPYTASSFQLAMCLYDWTTASFTRMVLMKIFQYTDIGTAPYPLDLDSIADAIWESNWGTYTPQNADYMHSFMMTPASSLADVQAQLNGVWPSLYRLSLRHI